jgi:hypothetical protein
MTQMRERFTLVTSHTRRVFVFEIFMKRAADLANYGGCDQ